MSQLLSVDSEKRNLLNSTVAMLAPWVYERKSMFTIGEIYLDPRYNVYLCIDKTMIKVIKEALAVLKCITVKDGGGYVDSYIPPNEVH